jgi:signal transduction histidine kinase
MVDADLLEQVVVNLLDNAIKFSPGGGVVTVRAYATTDDRRPTMDGRPEAAVVIAVADQGIGIPPDKLEMVFERFYQVDASTTRRFGGMGIGLALCKAIVEAHGGRIWAESKGEGHGSTFCAALPVM